MKHLAVFLLASFLLLPAAFGAEPKTYQVTGPVLDVKDDVVTVQKGSEKWEIARDKATKVSGDLKVGSRVTVYYQMKASSIEVKGDAKKSESKAKADTKK